MWTIIYPVLLGTHMGACLSCFEVRFNYRKAVRYSDRARAAIFVREKTAHLHVVYWSYIPGLDWVLHLGKYLLFSRLSTAHSASLQVD